MDIIGDLTEIWRKYNPAENEHGKNLLLNIENNRKDCQKLFFRCYYLFLLFSIFYYCIESKLIDNIELFSLKFSDIVILKWIIAPLITYLFYQGLIAFIFENLYRQAIDDYLKIYVPEVSKKSLQDLISSPSIISFERFLANKFSNKHTGDIFLILLILLTTLVPLLIIIYVNFKNISECHLVDLNAFKFITLLITFIIIIRISAFIYKFWKST